MRYRTAAFALSAIACMTAAPRNSRAQERSPNPNAPRLPDPGEVAPEPAPAPEPGADADEGEPVPQAAEDQRLALLEQELAELRERVQKAEDARTKDVSPLTLNGYVDLGFFAPLGNDGVGWVRDVGNRQFPEYSGYAWTFVGDILGSTVNSRGEAADLGDAPGADRFDSVDSDGA